MGFLFLCVNKKWVTRGLRILASLDFLHNQQDFSTWHGRAMTEGTRGRTDPPLGPVWQPMV